MICLFQEMMLMVNPILMKRLFKPFVDDSNGGIVDFIINKVGERKYWKIQFEQECSKATDESCINIECRYNYLNMHDNELYVELMQEIQAERLAIKKRDEEYRKKH